MRKSGFTIPILYFIAITILLLLPGKAFPQETFLSKIYFDKWVHISIFMMLVILWGRSYKTDMDAISTTSLLILLLSIGYGVVIEFIQEEYIPYRSFEVGDILADAVGAFIGWVIVIKK